MSQPKKNWARSLSDAINLTTTIAASVAIGYFGGRWLDTKFSTEPWLALLGFLLGVATAGKVMWDRMNTSARAIKTTDENGNQDSN